jgi:hypothetical protein
VASAGTSDSFQCFGVMKCKANVSSDHEYSFLSMQWCLPFMQFPFGEVRQHSGSVLSVNLDQVSEGAPLSAMLGENICRMMVSYYASYGPGR